MKSNGRLVLRLAAAGVLAAFAAFATGCATYGVTEAPSRNLSQDADIVEENYKAADALLQGTPYLRDSYAPLLVGSFVNINNMETSSALGRITSEQIGSRFAQKGFTVVEMKLRNNVLIRENSGEFVLSREVRELAQTHNAHAVIAGTYAVGRQAVYFSARVVRVSDSRILAGYDYALPMGPDTRALVASN